MFTVTVGFDASGNSRTRMPLGSEYSVIPSTDATCVAFGAACAARWPGRAWLGRVCALTVVAADRSVRARMPTRASRRGREPKLIFPPDGYSRSAALADRSEE